MIPQASPAEAEPVTSAEFDIYALMQAAARVLRDNKGRRLLSKADVLAKTGISPTDLWRMLDEGRFPPPRLRSPTRLCWIEDEVDAWIDALPVAPKLPSPNKAAARKTSAATATTTN